MIRQLLFWEGFAIHILNSPHKQSDDLHKAVKVHPAAAETGTRTRGLQRVGFLWVETHRRITRTTGPLIIDTFLSRFAWDLEATWGALCLCEYHVCCVSWSEIGVWPQYPCNCVGRARERERETDYLLTRPMSCKLRAAGLCQANKAIDWSTLHCSCVPLNDILWGSKFVSCDWI